jgi:hypothetical protein
MSIDLFSGPVMLLLLALAGWFGYQQLHKRRIANGADPASGKASCLMTALLIGVPTLFFILYWINANWTV